MEHKWVIYVALLIYGTRDWHWISHLIFVYHNYVNLNIKACLSVFLCLSSVLLRATMLSNIIFVPHVAGMKT